MEYYKNKQNKKTKKLKRKRSNKKIIKKSNATILI